MIKFAASNKWYELAAKSEADVLDLSAGLPTLPNDNVSDFALAKDLKQIRKLEGFSILLRMLRLNKGLTVEKLAEKIDVDIEEIILLERQVGYKATPRTLVALAGFYSIPIKTFLQMIGAIKNIDSKVEQEVIRFAAESESFEKLTSQEKSLLDRTMGIISKLK